MESKAFNRIGAGAMVGYLVSQLLLFGFTWFVRIDISESIMTMIQYGILYGSFILILWLFLRNMPDSPYLHDRHLTSGQVLVLILTVLLVDLGTSDVFYYIGSYIENVFSWIIHGGSVSSVLFEDYTKDGLFNWGLFFVVCFIGPVCEELLFRGLILKKLLPFGDACAILVSGVMFGLFHGNFIQMFYAATGGFLLGYVYVHTGSLFAAITLHALSNLMTYLSDFLLFVGLSDVQTARFLGGFTVITWVAAAAVIAVFSKDLKLQRAKLLFSRPINVKFICSRAGMIAYGLICFLSCIYYILVA